MTLWHTLDFPDVWLRADTRERALELARAEVARYGHDLLDDELEEIDPDGPEGIVHVNTA